jgi:CubicO group peptidase (beta-lactamase class C family)
MFTAAMILKLAEAGKLSLDDPLALYLADFPNGASITIRELLNHTAGISETAKNPQPEFARRDVDTATQIAEISKRPLDFTPGTRWSYSNAGFILLGAVIEKITGESWHTAIAEQILQPLGMKRTLYGNSAPLILGRAAGYTTDNPDHVVENAPFISATIPAAAGALVSTVDDLELWMRALTTGRVISKEDFQQMITPGPKLPGTRMTYGYGFGTFVFHVRGNTMIGHTGQIPGFASAVGYLPDRDITVIVLGNDDNFDAQTMGRRLAAIALGKPYPEVISGKPTDEDLRSLAGTYQFDENTVETLSIRGDKIYAQRGGRNVIRLEMTADKQLHFVPDELSYFMPVRDAAGRILGLDYFENGDGPSRRLPRK